MTFLIDLNSYRAAIVTHKDISLDCLSHLYFDDVMKFLKRLKDSNFSAVLLQTCNRIELYTYENDPYTLNELRVNDKFIKYSKPLKGFEVFRHLTRVTCGLESIAVGEHQIMGQVRKYYSLAKQAGVVTPPLQFLFDEALKIGRKVRAKVSFKGAMDYISATLMLLKKKLPKEASVAIVGTGDAAKEIAVRLNNLKDRSIKLHILGRNLAKVNSLSKMLDANPFPLHRLSEVLTFVDGLVVATSASKYIVKGIHLKNRNDKLVAVDLSTPPNISPSVVKYGVELYTMKNLSEIVKLNKDMYINDVRMAERIVENELKRLHTRIRSNVIETIIAEIYEKAKKIREEEVKEALRYMRQDKISKEKFEEIISAFSWSIIKKLYHHHATTLRNLACNGSLDDDMLSLIIELFYKR